MFRSVMGVLIIVIPIIWWWQWYGPMYIIEAAMRHTEFTLLGMVHYVASFVGVVALTVGVPALWAYGCIRVLRGRP